MIFEYMDQLLAEDRDRFTVDSDAAAEWAARKIREREAERDRLIRTAEEFVRHYQNQIDRARTACANETAFLLSCLEAYFDTVDRKATKTQQTYQLPSFRLKRKRQNPEFVKDNTMLLEWARGAIGSGVLVRVKEEPAWDAIKAACIVNNGELVYEATGEVVPGVQVVDRPPVFSIESI